MAKKKFGISPAVNRALTQTIEMAETESSPFHNTEILMNRIVMDPQNPRKHHITLKDIENGLDKADPLFEAKEKEYEGLCELAGSIKKDGLLHPIVVVEHADKFMLVAGERRYLASLIAAKKAIEARVFKTKPKNYDLRVIQWTENQSRKDLPLYEKLLNVAAIMDAYQEMHAQGMTAIKLSEELAVSRQQAQYYKAILENKALLKFIQRRDVVTFDLARNLSSYTQAEIEKALAMGTGVLAKSTPNLPNRKGQTVGRKRQSINLGKTKKTAVVQKLAALVLENENFKQYEARFSVVDWQDPNQASKAFKQLLTLMEKEVGALVS